MALYKIPLSNTPQRFELSVGDYNYIIANRYNSMREAWEIDLLERDGTPILLCLPLVDGADILGDFGYLELDFIASCLTDGSNDIYARPTFENLGTESNLYFLNGD